MTPNPPVPEGIPHSRFAKRHVMVMAAPNGARRSRIDHPKVPLTAEELAGCAAELLDAGVSVLHLHVRDGSGCHTLDPDRYRTALERIRRAVGERLVLQITTEAVGRYTAPEQMSVVRELRPEAVSLALRELCPEDGEAAAGEFFAWLVKERIWPQYILYSADDLRRFETLRKRGVFAAEHPACLFVLGRYAGERAGDPAELDEFLSAVDCSAFPWSVCCFGPEELAAVQKGAELGGHVRLGFENNLLLADGSRAGDNAALIVQFTTAMAASPRRPASADDVRGVFLHPAS